MSGQARQQAFDCDPQKLPDAGVHACILKQALMVMGDLVGEDGSFYCTTSRLMRYCGISEATAKRIRRALLGAGLISKSNRTYVIAGQRTPGYQWHFRAVAACALSRAGAAPPALIGKIDHCEEAVEGGVTQTPRGQERGGHTDPPGGVTQTPILNQSREQEKTQQKLGVGVGDFELNGDPSQSCPYQELLDLYREILPNWKQVRFLTDKRKAIMRARWKSKPDIDWWRRFMDYAGTLVFLNKPDPRTPLEGLVLNDETKSWCSLDFLFTEAKWVKLIEGAYEWQGFWRERRFTKGAS